MQAYLFVLEYSTSYNKTQCQLSKRLAGPIIAHSLWCNILLLVLFGRGFYLLMWFLAALADLQKQGRQDIQDRRDRRDAEHWTMLSLWNHRDIRMISWQVCHVWPFGRVESLLNISKEKSDRLDTGGRRSPPQDRRCNQGGHWSGQRSNLPQLQECRCAVWWTEKGRRRWCWIFVLLTIYLDAALAIFLVKMLMQGKPEQPFLPSYTEAIDIMLILK